MSIEILINKFALGLLSKENLVSFANAELENGNEMESILNVVVNEDDYEFDLSKLVNSICESYILSIPEKLPAVKFLIHSYLENHLRGKIGALEVVRIIRNDLYSQVEEDYPNDQSVGESLNLFPLLSLLYQYEDLIEDDPRFLHSNRINHHLSEIVTEITTEANNYLRNEQK